MKVMDVTERCSCYQALCANTGMSPVIIGKRGNRGRLRALGAHSCSAVALCQTPRVRVEQRQLITVSDWPIRARRTLRLLAAADPGIV